jgi:hypothetical protein
MQVFAEDIHRTGRRFLWDVEETHVGFVHFSATFAMITLWAGSYHIIPLVTSTHVPGDHMVNRHAAFALPAILTGIIVASKYLAPRQFDVRPWTMDLQFQPDDRGPWDQLLHGFNVAAAVHHHVGLA